MESSNWLPRGNIKDVVLFIAGEKANERDQSCIVTNKNTFKIDGIPYPYGVYDAHMGTTSNLYFCLTCMNTKEYCPGHHGIMELNYPVKNGMFKDFIALWLSIICHSCGMLYLVNDINNIKTYRKEIRQKLASKNTIKCHHCNSAYVVVSQDKVNPLIILKEVMNEISNKIQDIQMYNKDIKTVLDRVPDSVLKKFNIHKDCHPRNLILEKILVPANTTRPDSKNSSNIKDQTYDITALLKTIQEINEQIPKNIGSDMTKEIQADIATLELAYFTMVRGVSEVSGKASSSKVTMIKSNKRTPQSLANRLPKKHNRIRGTLLGKRTHRSGRSVISGDSTLHPGELGFPVQMAREIQVPVVIRPWNIDEMQIYFINGRNKYPGCTKIKKHNTNIEYIISNVRNDFKLEIGDTIYRDLIDGDVVAFNRAPTLLPSNISCHKIKVKYDSLTLSFNVSVCNLYNADFDGDAMQTYIPKSIISRVEAEHLLSVSEHMASYKTGAPMVGMFQDALVGVALFSQSTVKFTKLEAMQLFSRIDESLIPNVTFDQSMYTSYDILSMIMPNINYQNKSKIYDPDLAHLIKYDPQDIKVFIDSGKYNHGVLDKKSVGQDSNNTIIQVIKNKYGSQKALDFIFTLQQIIMNYLTQRGFTLSIKDLLVPKHTLKDIHIKLSEIIEESHMIYKEFESQVIPPIGLTVEQYYESKQLSALAIADDFKNLILGAINAKENNLYILASSGSKGNIKNQLMISSATGQQVIDGKMPEFQFSIGRCFPYYTAFTNDPESRGFIPDCYMTGLNSVGLIAQSMDARRSLTHKALSTSITGTQNRQSVKNLESIVISNHRSSIKHNRIIQILYGESGLDLRNLELNKYMLSHISNEEFSKYKANMNLFHKKYHNKAVEQMLIDEFVQLTNDRQLYRDIFINLEYASAGQNRLVPSKVKLPFNIARIIDDVQFTYGKLLKDKQYEINPGQAITSVIDFCNTTKYFISNYIQEQNKSKMAEFIESSCTWANLIIRSYFCLTNLVKMKFTNDMLNIALDLIKKSWKHAYIDYGTAIGEITAQSFSEPLMQYVLDSHHRSGGSGTKTSGLVRIAEILGAQATEKMNNPTMFIQVDEEYENDIIAVQNIANNIEMMNIGRFLKNKIQIFFEKLGEPVHHLYKHEAQWIKQFLLNNPAYKPPNDLITRCLRLELSSYEIVLKNMTIELIVETLQLTFPYMYIVYTPQNTDNLILRIYFRNEITKKAGTVDDYIKNLIPVIKSTVARGVSGVKQATVVKDKIPRTIVNQDGSLTTKSIYIIDTDGTNLEEVVTMNGINTQTLQSDSITEIAEQYGIEAARSVIMNELKIIVPSTMTDGLSHSHFTLYADEMTFTGTVTGIEKVGLSKREPNNCFLNMSMGKPIQEIENAAFKGTINPISGITSKLFIGQSPNIGSKYNTVTINENFVSQNVTSIESIIEDL